MAKNSLMILLFKIICLFRPLKMIHSIVGGEIGNLVRTGMCSQNAIELIDHHGDSEEVVCAEDITSEIGITRGCTRYTHAHFSGKNNGH